MNSQPAIDMLNIFAEAIDAGLIVLDDQGRIRLWNRWVEQFSRRSFQEVAGLGLTEAFAAPIDRRIAMGVREVLDLGLARLFAHALHPTPFPLFAIGDQSTTRIKQSVKLKPLKTPQGIWCLLQIMDVTEVVRREQLLRQQSRQLSDKLEHISAAQEQLFRSEQRFRELAKQAPVGIFEVDLQGVVRFANDRWLKMAGVTPDEQHVVRWTHNVADEDIARIERAWSSCVQLEGHFAEELRYTDPANGNIVWVRLEASALRGEDGNLVGYIGTVVDIHDVKESAIKNELKASQDVLTGLYNREYLSSTLQQALKTVERKQVQPAVLFLDLDLFKEINDEYGHEAGDIVLRSVARRLKRTLRGDDVIARFGGDEFVVMLADVKSPEDLPQIASKVRMAISLPINIGVKHVTIHASIGWASYPHDGVEVLPLLRLADERMYLDKRGRR
ncbi:sensor domain-containing diguanylate cyclase [Leeia oryzae]|uniref:sensor domain-containing diguanylate cyclase n=1 Tax=Leeia oryzae TaxID=356662 RepID=UPI0003686073|nr:sensor domain-containing diguanylate cyclase [Leeia oryzae]